MRLKETRKSGSDICDLAIKGEESRRGIRGCDKQRYHKILNDTHFISLAMQTRTKF